MERDANFYNIYKCKISEEFLSLIGGGVRRHHRAGEEPFENLFS